MDYKHLTTEQLKEYFDSIDMSRKVNKIHVHHTWLPDHDFFNKYGADKTQNNMYSYHVNDLGWSDIGQHLTLFPDGTWGTGRSFDYNPASIKGYNSNAFAIEMVGNFDIGNDIFDGNQRMNMYDIVAFLLKYFRLTINDIVFHREKSSKTCPGTSIDKDIFIMAIENRLEETLDDTHWKGAQTAWDWAKETGLLDGNNPDGGMTRLMFAQAMYNLEHKK